MSTDNKDFKTALEVNVEVNQKKQSDTKISKFLNENPFVKNIFDEKISTVIDEIDNDIFEISQIEAEEMLTQINPLIDKINDKGLSLDASNELKRYLHTLKGSVRMAGANKIGMVAHRLESLMDYMESRSLNMFDIKDLLESELYKISFLMKAPNQSIDYKKAQWLDLPTELEEQNETIATTEKTKNAEVAENLKKVEEKREHKQYIRVASDVIDNVITEAGEIRLTRTSLEDVAINNRKAIADLNSSSSKLLKMLREIEVQAESQMQAQKDKAEESDDFDPLEFDRFTRLQELTRFMNEVVADIQDTISNVDSHIKNQENAISQQTILTNNVLETLMKVRLVPVDSISERLYKITRNTAKELGKKVSLELFGEKTEIDRLVLDKMTSPIEHVLRNCIAHGIESNEKRVALNKPQVGKIKIKTSLEGNFIIISINDDGQGIDVEKVREIGIKKGLISPNKQYSKNELINLILQAGFSTADTVSQVSGRGVGMDVVKSEITALGGTIKIETENDKGSLFTFTLPVSVATNQVMLCESLGKLVAIPALSVEEVMSVKKDKLIQGYESGKLTTKNGTFDLYHVGHLLGTIPRNQKPEIKTYNSLIHIKHLGESIVVHVDKLITTTEVVVKPVGTILGKTFGVLGATVLGNGRQGMVINPVLMLRHYNDYVKNIDIVDNVKETKKAKKDTITVMVVDDSITVRRATTKVLEKYNYNIVLGKDGEDALEKLQLVIPDIILSDIEMPRMDGFEFAKNVRNIEKYSHIPIIMITSRTADKHKKMAFDLGVNDFLGKPYKEEELIEKIKLLTNVNV